MNRDVYVTISGLHTGDNGEDRVESSVPARHFVQNGSHYILYDEYHEDFGQSIKNRIKFRENYLEILKQGAVETRMIFEENRTHMTNYHLPYGDMALGLHTDYIKYNELDDEINIKVKYSLELNGEHQADSSIEIKIYAT
jgi:uncharacterized beta-barrel protein YwiB (DUF1934 family)